MEDEMETHAPFNDVSAHCQDGLLVSVLSIRMWHVSVSFAYNWNKKKGWNLLGYGMLQGLRFFITFCLEFAHFCEILCNIFVLA